MSAKPAVTAPAEPVVTGRDRRRPGPEAWSWVFMRLSGLVLLFLALAHFAITHLLNDVVETDYRFVADRWSNPLWRGFDWLLLVLALGHGANGVRVVVGDYVRSPRARRAALGVLGGLTVAMAVAGTLSILTFEAP